MIRRRGSNVLERDDGELPLVTKGRGGISNRRRKLLGASQKRDYSSWLVVLAMIGGIILMIRLFQTHPPTDATTIPTIREFLKQGAPVAHGQFAVFVTKSNSVETRTALGRSATSPLHALQHAQAKLPASTIRFPWIKVEVVTKTQPVSDHWGGTSQALPANDAPDWWYGMALDWQNGWAFSPNEVNAETLVDDRDQWRWDRLGLYLASTGRTGWPTPDIMVDDSSSYPGFEYILTKAMFCDLSQDVLKPVSLYHGHVMYPELSSTLLMDHATQAGQFLTRHVRDDGSMLYMYHPRSDVVPDDENLTRHAGTLYAMACLYAKWNDPDLVAAIERGLSYILERVKPCPSPYSDGASGMCIHEDGPNDVKYSKLGENALTLLALVQYMDATGSAQYHDIVRNMAAWIVGCQKEDGSFVQQMTILPNLKLDDDFFVRYYQGEATFALAKLYRVFARQALETDDMWMTVASKSALYIVSKDSKDADEDLTNDHWLMYGIGEMHPIVPEKTLQQHALRTARVASELQTPEDNDIGQDRLGLFDDNLSVTSCATYTEGLCAVYDMAMDIGDTDQAEQILNTVTLGLRHQLQAQYVKGDVSMHMKDPLKILGGFHSSIMEWDMRNDFTQHNLSSMLCLAKILESQGQ